MCGYCIEGAVVLDFVQQERAGLEVELEDPFVVNYLQETVRLPERLQHLQGMSQFPYAIEVVLCRAWEDALWQGRSDTFHRAERAYGQLAIAQALASLEATAAPCLLELAQRTGDIRGSLQPFMADHAETLLAEAEHTLRGYRDWWLLGQDKELSDPGERMRKTGLMDPLDDTTPADFQRFHASFPVVFLAWLVLAHGRPHAPVLDDIALLAPHAVPGFEGFDLWLQRHAFLHCLRTHGFAFVNAHFAQIRYALLYYAIVRQAIPPEDQAALSARLAAAPKTTELGVDAEIVLDLLRHGPPSAAKNSGSEGQIPPD